jgi:hypothetical protein
MQAEVEQTLKEVRSVKNLTDSKGRLITKAKRYLKFHERQSRNDELKNINEVLNPGNFALASMTAEGRANLAKRRRAIEDQLEQEAPPSDISGETKDALANRLNGLNEDIRTGMPTVEQMRRNPPGAVDQHRKWEKANKARILERANILQLLNPEDDSKDLTNIDMIRPSELRQGTATFMSDAQIPGAFAMTAAAKANWPEGMTEVAEGSPLAQAERRELEEFRAAKAAARQRGLELAAKAKLAKAARV